MQTKVAKKKVAKKAQNSTAGVHPDQKDLPGVETDRIPAIETAVKHIVEKQSQRKALKEELDMLIDKLPVLFKKHSINQYSCHGKTVVVTAGGVEVRIKKAKSQ